MRVQRWITLIVLFVAGTGMFAQGWTSNNPSGAVITSDRVGIGTPLGTMPGAALHVSGSALPLLQLQSGSVMRMFVDASGNVGVATGTPQVPFDVGGWAGKPGALAGAKMSVDGDLFAGLDGTAVGRARLSSNSVQGFMHWNLYWNGSGLLSIDNTRPSYEMDMNSNQDAISFRRYAAGSGYRSAETLLTIAKLPGGGNQVTVNGKLVANQVIGAIYQDIAEWVPATTSMSGGTVVVLNPDAVNQVMPSAHSYDAAVAGVVTEQPGVVLGVAGDSKEQIATYGRVRVRVDATGLPIRVGDLLVTSDKPGMAMRSEPLAIGGRAFHQPGTIIGKALEPLPDGEGEILVLLSLQ